MIQLFFQYLFSTLESFSVYLLLGFFLSALLRLFIKPKTIQKLLGKRNAFSVTMASLIGVPMPLCSCSVIPVGVSLRKSGASDGATLSFFTSTPVTGVDSIAMSLAMLPPPLAIARPIVALVLGLLSGLFQILFFKDDEAVVSEDSEESTSTFFENLKECVDYVIFDLFPALANTLFIGVVLAAVLMTAIKVYNIDIGKISTENDILDMVVVIIMGIPIYVCATGSTPIAAAFIIAGMKPELAFVFLIAGPATNITTISTVTSLFKVRTMVLYLVVIFAGSIIAGYLLGHFWGDALDVYAKEMRDEVIGGHNHAEHSSGWLVASATWLMLGAFGAHYYFAFKFKFSRKKGGGDSHILKLKVDKITCQNCVKKIDSALSAFDHISLQDVDVASKTIVLTSASNIEQKGILEKLASIGFPAEVIIEQTHQLMLKVESMTCQNCVRKIEGALLDLPDIQAKNFDVPAKIIQLDSQNKIDPSTVVSKLKEIGFEAEIVNKD